MNWEKTMNMLIAGLIIMLIGTSAMAISPYPNPVELTQPDGTTFMAATKGWDFKIWLETDEGYTITQNEDGWYVYANLDPEGRFAATSVRIGKTDAGEANLKATVGRHLTERDEVIDNLKETIYARLDDGILQKELTIATSKSSTETRETINLNVPVLLIQYPDNFASQTETSFDNMMNQTEYNGTGSFKEYYLEVSYGELDITASVVGWYTAPNNRADYGIQDYSTERWLEARQLAREAIDRAEMVDDVDWSNFDNDLDGNVDAVFIVHQGPGAECSGNPLRTTFIHSHAWFLNHPQLGDISATYDGVTIDRYIMMPEISCDGDHIEIGVFCHEFGHVLGLPDLYDTDNDNGESAGIGIWGLMGAGSWGGDGETPETPTHMCAWSKVELGWVEPLTITENTDGNWICSVIDGGDILKLWTDGEEGQEYFLVENRQRYGFDSGLPTSGLAIWHIDETVSAFYNKANADADHKMVDLEEADWQYDLDNNENLGDGGDLYPGINENHNFLPTTNPNSDDNNGQHTFVSISNIYNDGGCISADIIVSIPEPPNLIIRDCEADIGVERDIHCESNWYQSPDIWIDNNDDGIMDAPIQGEVNHLYVRAWNDGGPTANAKVSCYFVNPSLGLRFPGNGTRIYDSFSFEWDKTIPNMGYYPPTPMEYGYQTYFNWNIPIPPPDIDHYCMGCIIQNTEDPQTSEEPLEDNNLAQINYWAFARKVGENAYHEIEEGATETVFRQSIDVSNPFEITSLFVIVIDIDQPGFEVFPSNNMKVMLGPSETTPVTIDIIKHDSQHRDSANAYFTLYKLPEMERVGGAFAELLIDDVAPQVVGDFQVDPFELYGDNLPRPIPTHVLTWYDPVYDLHWFTEGIRYFEIWRDTIPEYPIGFDTIFPEYPSFDTIFPDQSRLIAKTKSDAELNSPGYQFYFTAPDTNDYYFTAVAVDLAGNRSEPAPITSIWKKPNYLCGDVDGDGKVNIMDIVKLIGYLYKGDPEPPMLIAGDVSGDGKYNIIDVITIINYKYKGGPELTCMAAAKLSSTPSAACITLAVLTGEIVDDNTIVSTKSSKALSGLEMTVRTSGKQVEIVEKPEDLEVYYKQTGDIITIGLLNIQGNSTIESGENIILKFNSTVEIIDALGADVNAGAIQFSIINGSKVSNTIPDGFALEPNYPNPFNPATHINFSLPKASDVRLDIYNVIGQKVTTLAKGMHEAGTHTVTWDATQVSSGVYFYRLQADNFSATRKMLLMK